MGRFSKNQKRLAVAVSSVLVAASVGTGAYTYWNGKGAEELSYSEFMQRLSSSGENVKEVSLKNDVFYTKAALSFADGKSAVTKIPNDELLRSEIRKAALDQGHKLSHQTSASFSRFGDFFLIASTLGIAGFLVFQYGGSFRFQGKRFAKKKDNEGVSLSDVAGIDEVKSECELIVSFLKDPEKFKKMGVRIPRGILLHGDPGCGKTMLARALANEAGVPFYYMCGSDFQSAFAGVSTSRVKDLFAKARKEGPAIIFIDEIDAVAAKRSGGDSAVNRDQNQTLNALLVEMDGFDDDRADTKSVIVVGATNRPDALDPAILRPRRFDKKLYIGLPDLKGRIEMFNVHTRRFPLDPTVSLETLAASVAGFSGAQIENLVNEAGILAVREGAEVMTYHHFEAAKDKLLIGPERNVAMDLEQRKISAYHEAGHAVAAHLLCPKLAVHKVTIIPRGGSLGATAFTPKGESQMHTRGQILAEISTLLGGRAAEEIAFNDYTTGASDDLSRASDMAMKFVTRWGMSEGLGLAGVLHMCDEEGGRSRSARADGQQALDEAARVLSQCQDRSESVLQENWDLVVALADELLAKDTVDAAEFLDLCARYGTPPAKVVELHS